MHEVFNIYGILILLLNLFLLSKHKKIFETTEWIFKYKKVTGNDPTIEEVKKRIDFNILSIWSLGVIFTTIWILLGLLTDDWMIFLILLTVNIVFNKSITAVNYSEIKRKLLFSKAVFLLLVMFYLLFIHI